MRKAVIFSAVLFAVVVGRIPAQANEHLSASVAIQVQPAAIALALSPEGLDGHSATLDYAIFTHELLAFVLKEVFHDSGAEYETSSIPSRLSPEGFRVSSEFGAHCLQVLGRVRSEWLPHGLGRGESTVPALLAPVALIGSAAVIAVREVWTPVRNHVEGTRTGLALDPKVSSRKIGLALTWRW